MSKRVTSIWQICCLPFFPEEIKYARRVTMECLCLACLISFIIIALGISELLQSQYISNLSDIINQWDTIERSKFMANQVYVNVSTDHDQIFVPQLVSRSIYESLSYSTSLSFKNESFSEASISVTQSTEHEVLLIKAFDNTTIINNLNTSNKQIPFNFKANISNEILTRYFDCTCPGHSLSNDDIIHSSCKITCERNLDGIYDDLGYCIVSYYLNSFCLVIGDNELGGCSENVLLSLLGVKLFFASYQTSTLKNNITFDVYSNMDPYIKIISGQVVTYAQHGVVTWQLILGLVWFIITFLFCLAQLLFLRYKIKFARSHNTTLIVDAFDKLIVNPQYWDYFPHDDFRLRQRRDIECCNKDKIDERMSVAPIYKSQFFDDEVLPTYNKKN